MPRFLRNSTGMGPCEGILTAMVTPFAADGSVNEEAAVTLGRHLLANGSHGLVVGGTTGESATLSDEEQGALAALMVSELGDEATIVAGTGLQRHAPRRAPDRAGGRGRRARRPVASRPTTTSPTAAACCATSPRSRARPAGAR